MENASILDCILFISFTCNGVYFHNFLCSLQKRHCFSQDLQNKRYRMVSQKCGSQKILARSRKLASICVRSGSLVFRWFCISKSWILKSTVPQSLKFSLLCRQKSKCKHKAGKKEGETCDGEGTPSFAHDCLSLYTPSSLVSLAFLNSDVVFLPSLT